MKKVVHWKSCGNVNRLKLLLKYCNLERRGTK